MPDFEDFTKVPPNSVIGLAEVSAATGWSKYMMQEYGDTMPEPIGRLAIRNAKGNKHWATVWNRDEILTWGRKLQEQVDAQKAARRQASP